VEQTATVSLVEGLSEISHAKMSKYLRERGYVFITRHHAVKKVKWGEEKDAPVYGARLKFGLFKRMRTSRLEGIDWFREDPLLGCYYEVKNPRESLPEDFVNSIIEELEKGIKMYSLEEVL
jgi:hypothetical protein